MTPEEIAERLEEIRDLEGFSVPGDIYDEVEFIAATMGVTVHPR